MSSTEYSGVQFNPDSLGIVFDDSVIEDKAEEKRQDIVQINAGVMSKIEYRMKWFGETEDEATKAVEEISKAQLGLIE